ncbi:MAG: hypothetical protein Q9221_007768 [Calogaya cf. arnoldii]
MQALRIEFLGVDFSHQCLRTSICHLTLDGLSDDEAGELLLGAARVPDAQRSTVEGDAQAVVSLLSSHPLALIQAGSYISRGHRILAEYPRVFAQQRKRLLAFQPAQAHSRYRDVYATFEASAGILRASAEIILPSSTTESDRDALELLSVLAICGPSRLPLPTFEAGWKGAQKIGPDQANGNHDALRLTPWHGSRLPSFIQAGADAWDSFRLILERVDARVDTRLGKRWRRLFVLMNNLLAHVGLDRRKVGERWFPVYELTARNLVHYGKVKEAVSLLEEVVKIREQILAQDHPSRLASQHELATIYWDLNRHNNAVHMMKHVVGIRSKVLDEQHPDRKNSEAWLKPI